MWRDIVPPHFKHKLWRMKERKIYYTHNLESKIKDIKKDILKDCLKTKHKADYNFEIFTKHHDKLYSLFKNTCKKFFKKCTFKNHTTRLYGYYTDQNYSQGDTWHNHKNTCTICGVLYLKTVKEYGIELKYNNKIFYFEPKNFDLLIFPGFLDHRPLIHKTKKRVSIQFEIFCNESSEEIFFH